jgi:phage terminase small subunit
MTGHNLTPKQERFCLAYIETGVASEAYRQAYNAENMGGATIRVKACNLLKKEKVKARVAALHAHHRKRHDVTVDSLTAQLDRDHALAHKNKQAGAAVSATMGKAKLHGFLVDKVEATTGNKPSQMTDQELEAIARGEPLH